MGYLRKHSSVKESIVIYLQVAWIDGERVTWEIASALPESLIAEFESNEVTEPDVLRDSRFGVINHSLNTSKAAVAAPPPNKMRKCTRPSTHPG